MQVAAAVSLTLGGKPEWPDLAAAIARLDDYLASEPKHIDAEEAELRDALGLRRPGG